MNNEILNRKLKDELKMTAIRKDIQETLVIKNPESIDKAVEKILKLMI